MERTIKLPEGLPLFRPANRHAVLLNSYDNFPTVLGTNITDRHCRGNSRVYELEEILFERQEPKYDSVSKILPPKTDMGRVQGSLDKISSASSDNTLTFMYITAHGKVGSFALDRKEEIEYGQLLDMLDKVKGKKIVVALACYSGSLIDAWRERKTRDDYAILTSTTNGELGVNWGEDVLHDELAGNILRRGKLSELVLPAEVRGHHPQLVGSFDVQL